jgi:tRNA 2-selenouridine synthase
MPHSVESEEFLELSGSLPVIDVRSPLEFQKGHIPSAINIPLFENPEREKVGIIYHGKGRTEAIKKGFKIIGPKLDSLIQALEKQVTTRSLLLYCWRGGIRSSSMALLYEANGYVCSVLTGGYKSYRRFIRTRLENKANIILIGGMTGSGKTEVLRYLEQSGEQILDLEWLASHKGSVFGGFGEKNQPTTEQFENNLYDHWKKFDLSKRIWMEDESISLGNVFIPDPLWEQMKNSPVLCIKIPFRERVKRIIEKYSGINDDHIYEGLRKLNRRLGSEQTKASIISMNKKDYKSVAATLLKYYDKKYLHSLSERQYKPADTITLTKFDASAFAEKLINTRNATKSLKL